jgi:serine/threonine protein kinase
MQRFEPVELPKTGDIVGGTAPVSLRSMKLEDMPQERVSMAQTELEAMTRTIYYRKRRLFKREGSLDFEDPSRQMLRNLLAEPIGRFYLLEYARAKTLPDFEARASFCSVVVKLGNETEMEGRLAPEEPGVETDEERYQRLDLWTRNAFELHIAAQGRLGLEKFVTHGAEEHHRLIEAREKCEPLVAKLMPGAGTSPHERASVRATLLRAVTPLMHASFRQLTDTGAIQEFKEHSEYKRYKAKFQQCYNNINHEDFDFMATLGKGSFGRVLRVRKRTTSKQYAMKIMSKRKILSGAENAAQVTIERNVLVMCNSPSIVKVHFAFHTTRALFLVLDLLEGGTLVHAMNQSGGTMPLDCVVFHTAQMVLGLEHLHDHGILFRDLKPLNVLLDRKGNAVLTDMGLACKFRQSKMPEDEGAVPVPNGQPVRRFSIPILPKEKLKCVGTYGFRAPELLATETERNGYGPAVDYWALGVTVYYLLTAKMPFKVRQQSIMEAREKPKDTERRLQKTPPKLSSDLTPETLDFIKGLLRLDPNERYGDADLPGFKAHPFFKGIDWEKLSRRELTSPYKPGIAKHPKDEVPQFESVHAAMAQFTHENVLEMFGGENEMKDEYTHVPRAEQKHFRTWDFIPDVALEVEWDIAERDAASKPFPRRKNREAAAKMKLSTQPEQLELRQE